MMFYRLLPKIYFDKFVWPQLAPHQLKPGYGPAAIIEKEFRSLRVMRWSCCRGLSDVDIAAAANARTATAGA